MTTTFRQMMTAAHATAKAIRGEYASYAEAFRVALTAAWAAAREEKAPALARVESSSRLSNSAFHRSGGNGSGSARWWLRGASGFVTVPSVRGDSWFDEELDLGPGVYVLGTGRGRDAIRETIVVEAA
jgi:hypothetical protein